MWQARTRTNQDAPSPSPQRVPWYNIWWHSSDQMLYHGTGYYRTSPQLGVSPQVVGRFHQVQKTLEISPIAWLNTCACPTMMNYYYPWGWETHRNWACRPKTRHNTRAGTGKARNNRCRACKHRGIAQAQHTRSETWGSAKANTLTNAQKKGQVRAGRYKARTHKQDMQRKHPGKAPDVSLSLSRGMTSAPFSGAWRVFLGSCLVLRDLSVRLYTCREQEKIVWCKIENVTWHTRDPVTAPEYTHIYICI